MTLNEAAYATYGRVGVYCASVANGSKPAAEIEVLNEFVDIVIKGIDEAKLQHLIIKESETHKTIYMYKYKHVGLVIKEVLKLENNNPFTDWVRGKLFGYSEIQIAEFINGAP